MLAVRGKWRGARRMAISKDSLGCCAFGKMWMGGGSATANSASSRAIISLLSSLRVVNTFASAAVMPPSSPMPPPIPSAPMFTSFWTISLRSSSFSFVTNSLSTLFFCRQTSTKSAIARAAPPEFLRMSSGLRRLSVTMSVLKEKTPPPRQIVSTGTCQVSEGLMAVRMRACGMARRPRLVRADGAANRILEPASHVDLVAKRVVGIA